MENPHDRGVVSSVLDVREHLDFALGRPCDHSTLRAIVDVPRRLSRACEPDTLGPQQRTRVLLVGSRTFCRSSAESLTSLGVLIVGRSRTRHGALNAARSPAPDLALLDLEMGDIAACLTDVLVIIVSTEASPFSAEELPARRTGTGARFPWFSRWQKPVSRERRFRPLHSSRPARPSCPVHAGRLHPSPPTETVPAFDRPSDARAEVGSSRSFPCR